jgi:serine/threonine-protein kinase
MTLGAPPECLSAASVAAWVSGRLRGAELAGAEAHLADCPACAKLVGEAAGQARSATNRSAASAAEPFDWAAVETGEILAGRYAVGELIGQGSMGEVYRGHDRGTGEQVAIKRLKSGAQGKVDAELLVRFSREAEILQRLDHPGIVKLHAVIDEGERHSIVMEYVAGGSLRRELLRVRSLPPLAALLLGLEVSEALAQAHRRQVIHRDIKPENVLLAEDGSVRLSDFGLARLGERALTAPGTVLGTVAYLSPEMLWGQELDSRADLWSLGVLLFEMLSGVRPFVASSPGATLTAILREPAPSLWDVYPAAPAALVGLVGRLLQKDRERRIASAAELAFEIEALLGELAEAP